MVFRDIGVHGCISRDFMEIARLVWTCGVDGVVFLLMGQIAITVTCWDVAVALLVIFCLLLWWELSRWETSITNVTFVFRIIHLKVLVLDFSHDKTYIGDEYIYHLSVQIMIIKLSKL